MFRRDRNVSPLVTGGLDTVGIRVPAHPIAHSLLREFGGAIVAPSANRFGRVSCTSALHVADELGDRADLILDGGDCPIGLESTIVDVSSGQPSILRPGAVTAEDVARVIGTALTGHRSSAPRVSGSLPSHYAPRARLEIVTSEQLEGRARELVAQGCSVGVLTDVPIDLGPRIHNLHVSRNLAELAHDLYETLRRIDRLGCDVALVTLPPEAGLGAALIDRLRRAAGPRDEPA